MEDGWNGQDASWLAAIPLERAKGTAIPPDCIGAEVTAGALTYLYAVGEPVRAGDGVLLLAKTGPMTLHFAVGNALPGVYPGRPESFSLGLCAEVKVRAGPLSGLIRLRQLAGAPAKLSLRQAYESVLQPEMETLWRDAAAGLAPGPQTRAFWSERQRALAEAAQGRMYRLLLHYGILVAGDCHVSGIAPVRLSMYTD